MTTLNDSPKRIVFCWSGGKDSSLALQELLQKPDDYEIVALLTTVAKEFERISHHGVRLQLLEQQAESIGIHLDTIMLPTNASHGCTNSVYEQMMEEKMQGYVENGIDTVAFGDINLEDLRVYRENNLAKVAMKAIFPLWLRDTTELVCHFIEQGFKANLSCVSGEKLDESFAGRAIDHDMIRALPADVDPCGENGEFHSFVWDGPIFDRPVPIVIGETIKRDVRYFTDLLPVQQETPTC